MRQSGVAKSCILEAKVMHTIRSLYTYYDPFKAILPSICFSCLGYELLLRSIRKSEPETSMIPLGIIVFLIKYMPYLRMMCYSVMTQAYSGKEIPSSPNRSRTYDLPITQVRTLYH